jgi:hypothetical protein
MRARPFWIAMVQIRIVGQENLAPGAHAELFDDAEVGEHFADHGEFLHWQCTHYNLKYLDLPSL